MRRRLRDIIEKFRQKGATSQEKAMTLEELGLPPHFKEAMRRRLGQSGIFVEINGKFFLNEERLKQIKEQRTKIEPASSENVGRNRSGPPSWHYVVGILLMLPIGIIVAVVLFYFVVFKGVYFPGEFLIVLLVIFLALFVFRLLFWRSRRRFRRDSWIENEKINNLSHN